MADIYADVLRIQTEEDQYYGDLLKKRQMGYAHDTNALAIRYHDEYRFIRNYDDTQIRSEMLNLGNLLADETLERTTGDVDLQSQIDALHGAIIYIGRIHLPTQDVTQNALNNRAAELGYTPLKVGYVLIDDNDNDWWYNGTVWIDIGYFTVAQATETSLGVVKSGTGDLEINFGLSGVGTVNNLQTSLNGKANTVHAHAISDVTNLQSTLDNKEPTIVAGTTSQYWRGDKTWQAFPTIPTVGNGTITLQSGATNIGSFAVNQSGNTTIDIFPNNTMRRVGDDVMIGDANQAGTLVVRGINAAGDIRLQNTDASNRTGTVATVTGATANTPINTVANLYSHTHAVSLNAANVGLGNVNNTSDADKPVSTAASVAFSRIVNNQQTGNLIFEGNWTFNSSGVLAASNNHRVLSISMDRSESSDGYIDWRETNSAWPTITGLGTTPNIAGGTSITIPAWTSVIGRHTRGGGRIAITIHALTYTQSNVSQLLQPGDVILFSRNGGDKLQMGNGMTIGGNVSIVNGVLFDNHNHDASNITAGTLPLARGGTGGTSAQTAVGSLFPNNNTSPGFVAVFDSGYANPGYRSRNDFKNDLGSFPPSGAAGGDLRGNYPNPNVNQVRPANLSGANVHDVIYAQMADNDFFRLRIGGAASNAGYVEFATADDGNEPIHFSQYTGAFATLTRRATILDANGYTQLPSYIQPWQGQDKWNETPGNNSHIIFKNSGTDNYLRNYRGAANTAYVSNANGAVSSLSYTSAANANTLALRDGGGDLTARYLRLGGTLIQDTVINASASNFHIYGQGIFLCSGSAPIRMTGAGINIDGAFGLQIVNGNVSTTSFAAATHNHNGWERVAITTNRPEFNVWNVYVEYNAQLNLKILAGSFQLSTQLGSGTQLSNIFPEAVRPRELLQFFAKKRVANVELTSLRVSISENFLATTTAPNNPLTTGFPYIIERVTYI